MENQPKASSVIARNMISNLVTLLVTMLVTFFLAPFLVHSLGDDVYGLWVLIISVTGYMGLLDAGLKVSIVKYVSKVHAESDILALNKTICTSLAIFTCIAGIIVLITIVLSVLFDRIFAVPAHLLSTARIVCIIAGVSLAITFINSVFNGFLSGLQRYDLVNKVTLIIFLLRSACIVWFVLTGWGIVGIGLVHLFSQLLTGCFLLVVSLKRFPDLMFRFAFVQKEYFKKLFSYSVYIMLNNVAMLFLFRSGPVVAGMFLGTSAITYLAIAANLAEYLSKIIGSMTQVLHPYASSSEARGDTLKIRTGILVSIKMCLLIALPVSLAFVLLGDKFIGLWMGESYVGTAFPLLVVLAISRIFWLSQSGSGNIMLGAGKHKVLTGTNFVTGILGIVCGVLLIKRFGLLGMIIGMSFPIVISQLLILPGYICYTWQIGFKEYIVETWLYPVISVIPYAIVLQLFRTTSLPETFIGFGITIAISLTPYIILAYYTCFTHENRQALKKAIVLKYRSVIPGN